LGAEVKKYLFCFLFIIISVSYGSVQESVITNEKVAVMDIISRVQSEKIDTELFSEILQSEILHQKAFLVVERTYLSKIIQEQKLNLSGMTESDLTKIGKLAQADKIITGSISKMDNNYLLVVRLINTTSGIIEEIQEGSSDSVKGLIGTIPGIAAGLVAQYRGGKSEDNKVITEKEPVNTGTNTVKGFSPIQLSFVENIQLLPVNIFIAGISLDAITGYQYKVYGIQAGFINRADTLFGFQGGFIDTIEENQIGMQAGFINNCKGTLYGAQFGFINNAHTVYGAQIGFINSSDKLYGVQIGLINTIKENGIRFMFGINIGF
jgi:hypothetical protein